MISLTSNIYGIMVPPGPLLLEQAAKNHSSMILQTLSNLGSRLKAWNVATAIVVSGQWRRQDSFFVDSSAQHRTSCPKAGNLQSQSQPLLGDSMLAQRLLKAGKENLLFPETTVYGLDDTVSVPLQFLFPQGDVPVVPLSMGLSPLDSFRWGRTIGDVLRREKGNFLFLTTAEPLCSLITFLKQDDLAAGSLVQDEISNLLAAGTGSDACSSLFMLFGLLGVSCLETVTRFEGFFNTAMGIIEFADQYGQKIAVPEPVSLSTRLLLN